MRHTAAILLLALPLRAAHAHSVWFVPVDTPPGRSAHVVMSDSIKPEREELLARIAGLKVIARGGKAETPIRPEKKSDYLLAVVPEGAGRMLTGTVVAGVTEKKGRQYLMTFDAKSWLAPITADRLVAVLGDPAGGLDLEILVTKADGKTARCRAVWKGKPAPHAEAMLLVPGLDDLKLRTGADGEFEVPLGQPGVYGIQIKHAEKRVGEFEGKKYDDSRTHATLTFRLAEATADRDGAAGGNVASPEATRMLAEARAARAVWKNFPGFTADAEVNLDGKVSRGAVRVDADGTLTCSGLEHAAERWVKVQLGSVAAHRIDDGTPSRETPCAFGDDQTAHPFGRLVVVLNDELHSSYRIRDREIVEVNRVMKDGKFTISVLESAANADGKFLTTQYVVNYWGTEKPADTGGGKGTEGLVRSVSHHETWTRVGAFDLPATATVLTASAGPSGAPLTARTLTLRHHALVPADKGEKTKAAR